MKFLYIALIFTLYLISCTSKNNHPGNIVARVYDKYLYKPDIAKILPKDLSSKDSATFTENYINRWIKRNLIIRKAELNLTDEQKDIEDQLEDYRASLLIFKYEQKLLNEKLDSAVSDKEIEDYYNANSSEFILDRSAIKAIFVQVPKDAPDLGKVKTWCQVAKDNYLKQLEDYCEKYAKKYYFDDNWVYLSDVLKETKFNVTSEDQYLKYYGKFIDTQDSAFHYFVNIKEYKLNGDVAPLPIIKNKIITIILNKRKLDFIYNIENNLLEDGRSKKDFELFKSDNLPQDNKPGKK